ncbi:MAG: heavy metal translocating P-type ATPase [Thermoplasmata archaeon]
MATDPVCGMFVDPRPGALQLERENRTYYFCSESCLLSFAEPERERVRLLRRLGVAWPLSMVVLVLTYGPMVPFAPYFAAGLATIVQLYPGSIFYRGAYDSVRGRLANMDLLIAVGTTAAFAYSVAVIGLPGRLPPAYYFDASSLIVTLILTGNYLEQFTRSRAGSALRRLNELLPSEARLVRSGVEVSVPISEVTVGDLVRVRPGGRFPTDGIVRSGRTSSDESLLTGESMPVARGPEDRVLAGAINVEGMVDVEASQVGSDTFVAQVGQLLTTSEMSRVPLQRTADRIAAVFVPFVLGAATAGAIAWYLLGGANFTTALLIFVTVAITACPCAFGLATPAAILVGTGRAAEAGILFRGEDAIERAARADLVLADKTGTLTTTTPELSGVTAFPPATEGSLLALAAGLEAGSEHSLGRAVLRRAAELGVVPSGVEGFRADPGRGVRGYSEGRPVAILRGEAARQEGIDLSPAAAVLRSAEQAGDSWSAVLEGGGLVGILRFRAPIAPGAVEAVGALRSMGIEVVMVTGDHPAAAGSVARALGIERVHAECTPQRKVELVAEYQREGHRVAFVGDGVNDAAALASAEVGIAIGAGTDVAREAGQVLLVRPDLGGVPAALGMARRIVSRVRRNLVWAIGYNVVLLPIALGALVPWFGLSVYRVLPIFGAIAMGLSSTTVVLNSLSLRWALPRGVRPRVPGPERREERPSGA